MNQLFERNHPIYDEVNNLFVEIEWVIEDAPTVLMLTNMTKLFRWELLSTTIISAYLNECGFTNRWLDARDIIRTDNTHRNARVDWELTESMIQKEVSKGLPVLTQGFIGCTSRISRLHLEERFGFYSCYLSACCSSKGGCYLEGCPGILNADPRFFEDAQS